MTNNCIIVRTKSQLNVPHLAILPLPVPVTVKQRVIIIPGDQPEEGINGYGGKDFEKRKVFRREWKTPRERSTSGPGSEYVWERSMTKEYNMPSSGARLVECELVCVT